MGANVQHAELNTDPPRRDMMQTPSPIVKPTSSSEVRVLAYTYTLAPSGCHEQAQSDSAQLSWNSGFAEPEGEGSLTHCAEQTALAQRPTTTSQVQEAAAHMDS